MGIKRIVDTAFWTDGKVDEFSPEDKYFMLYLLTNPFSKQLGIYEISIKQAAFQMGYSIDAFNVLLDRFENKYKMIVFSKETNEIAIVNFLRHSVMKGGKPVEDCIKQDMAKVKNKKLIDYVFSRICNRDDLNVTVKKIVDEYINENDIHIDNDNHNDNDNDRTDGESHNDSCHDSSKVEMIKVIVSYLNERAGTRYKHNTDKTQKAINARFNEGFTVDDFMTVIDKKCNEWIGTEFEKFLRPETLFGTKFEGYLNSRINPKATYRTNGRPSKADELNDFYSMAADWAESE